MIETIKTLFRGTRAYPVYRAIQLRKGLRDWKKSGRSTPLPPLEKQRMVREYAGRFPALVFVETGTYFGDMVHAVKGIFARIYSIELDGTLYDRAKKRFSRFSHISILHGDSNEILPGILRNVTQPCLFWLDAHYSGGITTKGRAETPIMQELHCILGHPVKGHVILIDDARMFTGQNDYPTVREIEDLVRDSRPEWVFEVRDDIIRIHGRPPAA